MDKRRFKNNPVIKILLKEYKKGYYLENKKI